MKGIVPMPKAVGNSISCPPRTAPDSKSRWMAQTTAAVIRGGAGRWWRVIGQRTTDIRTEAAPGDPQAKADIDDDDRIKDFRPEEFEEHVTSLSAAYRTWLTAARPLPSATARSRQARPRLGRPQYGERVVRHHVEIARKRSSNVLQLRQRAFERIRQPKLDADVCRRE